MYNCIHLYDKYRVKNKCLKLLNYLANNGCRLKQLKRFNFYIKI